MAKEAPKKEEAAVEPAAPKKSKKLLFIASGVVIAAIVAGVVVGMLLGGGRTNGSGPNAEHAEAEEQEVETPKFDPSKPPVFVNLDPFTVNLQPENGEQFLQVVTTFRVVDDKVGEQLKLYMPQIRHEILALMSAKKPSEITAPDGREYLADEVREVTNEVLGYKPPKRKKKSTENEQETGPVVSVFFTQFIVQ